MAGEYPESPKITAISVFRSSTLTGTYHLLLKKDLVEVIHHQDSLMPRIDLTESELQNLLAFLSRQTLGMPAEKIKTFEHGKEKEP